MPRYSFFILALLLLSSVLLANPRLEVKAKPSPDTVIRSEALREIYRPDTKVELGRLLESVGEGDKRKIRDFLEGKSSALSEADFRGLSDVYRRYQAKGQETQTALAKAVKSISDSRLTELKGLVPAEFHEGLTRNATQRLFVLESQKAAGMSKVSLTGLPEGVRGELVGEGGPWERYLRANPEAKVADREAALTDLANLVDRAHKELSGEVDADIRRLVMDLARIAAGDMSVLREVSTIAPKLHSSGEGKDVAKVLDGLRTALLAAEYARGTGRAAARAELALQIAKGNVAKAKELEAAMEKAEAKQDPELLQEVRNRFKDILENEEGLGGAKTLNDLVHLLDRRIAEEKGDVLESLKEFRDYIEGKRLVLALNEIEGFRRMNAEAKLAVTTCALRSAGRRSAQALAGASAGLMAILGFSPVQFNASAAKIGGFKVPDKILSNETVQVVRVPGPGSGGFNAVSSGGAQ